MRGKVIVREKLSIFNYKEDATNRLHRSCIQERLAAAFGSTANVSQSDAVRAALAFAFFRKADFVRWINTFVTKDDADANS